MELLVLFQHFDKLRDLAGARLGFLHRLNAKKNGVAIRAVQSLKEFICGRAGGQSGSQIPRDSRATGGIVSGIPTAVDFGALNSRVTGGLHSSARTQREGFFAVDLRPDAFV